jgi:hypothetical protein
MTPKDKEELEASEIELLKIRDTYQDWIADAAAELIKFVQERWPMLTFNEAVHLFDLCKIDTVYTCTLSNILKGVRSSKNAFSGTLEGYA